MRPLALAYARQGEIEPDELRPVLDGLAVPPAGGFDLENRRDLAWAQWQIPSAAEVRPPAVRTPAVPTPFRLLFDGRLDNRRELLAALDLQTDLPADLSDRDLVHVAFSRWGEDTWDRLLGPFVAVVHEPFARRLTLVREILGGRSLFFHVDAERLVVASEPAAVTRHPRVDDRLSEEALRAWCTLDPIADGRTFFAAVEELPPGSILRVTPERVTRGTLEIPRPASLGLRRDEDYAEAFRELLRRAVDDRLASSGSTGLLMSGGLDSTAVAALGGADLQAFSWVFPGLPGADESAYIQAVDQALPLTVHPIVGDDAVPLGNPEEWVRDPNGPVEGPYRELRRRAYSRAAEKGCTVLLTGEYGDELFAGAGRWLRDWLRERGPSAPAAHLLRHARPRSEGPLGLRSGLAGLRRPRNATEALPVELEQTFLGSAAAQATVFERRHALPHGLDIRRPFRDRRLLSFMAGVPGHLLFRPGWTKWLLRQSLVGLLPESVRLRRRAGSLLPLFVRGVRRNAIEPLFDGEASRFVDPKELRRTLNESSDGPHWVVLWRSLCLNLWTRHRLDDRKTRSRTVLP